jgi:hypothetical protein
MRVSVVGQRTKTKKGVCTQPVGNLLVKTPSSHRWAPTLEPSMLDSGRSPLTFLVQVVSKVHAKGFGAAMHQDEAGTRQISSAGR